MCACIQGSRFEIWKNCYFSLLSRVCFTFDIFVTVADIEVDHLHPWTAVLSSGNFVECVLMLCLTTGENIRTQ